MELSSEEGEIPIPINTTISSSNYGGVEEHGNGHRHEEHGNIPHHHHHHHHHNGSSVAAAAPPALQLKGQVPYNKNSKKVVKYRECLKNHAASMGGNALDGCGEFMPSGEEGTLEALTCSACNCHRNFHRKEVEGQEFIKFGTQKFILGPNHHNHHNHHLHLHHKTSTGGEPLVGYPTTSGTTPLTTTTTILPSRAVPPHMILPYNVGSLSLPSECDEEEEEEGGGMIRPIVAFGSSQIGKKRFRTKFTQEQKEKMLGFAERVGWKIQKQEESVVQQFCQEIGVKRRVLKVWMHNNKHNFAKRLELVTFRSSNSVA
ncbi:zinc-finger homeodomain protein 4 [Senna tora]|uniref:Zinc-finger homeodomain protein 4 n=1 Tax=Senna tora TaxID=362788 RepID=A0A834XGI3_9FABA|nr:zinc-finger homeodomain protein 4 [Senna tora]